MIYFQLMAAFAKIGLFSFGGGYAMIPLIQKEIVENNSWLTARQFVDIIAVAETTPGPIAVNSATFVGYKVAGFWGALVSTIGVCLPTFILVLILSKAAHKFSTHPVMQGMLYGIRPVVLSLILMAAIFVGETVMLAKKGFLGLDWISVAIAASAFIAYQKFKIHPILLIVIAGTVAIFLY